MRPNERFRSNVRGFYAYLGSVALAMVGPMGAGRLLETRTIGARVGAVAIGVLAWIPLMYMVGRIIARGDEFARRIQLMALALAFPASLVLISLLDWLSRAGFVAPPPLTTLWLLVAMLWGVSVIGAKRYYERVQ